MKCFNQNSRAQTILFIQDCFFNDIYVANNLCDSLDVINVDI